MSSEVFWKSFKKFDKKMNLITVRGCNLEDRISNRSCVYNGLFINTGCEHGAILISSNRNVDSSISSGQLIS